MAGTLLLKENRPLQSLPTKLVHSSVYDRRDSGIAQETICVTGGAAAPNHRPDDAYWVLSQLPLCSPYMPLSLFHLPRRLEDTSEEFTGSQIGIKKGVWGESRFDFESIVEEVRRFVARMPPADSTTGLACCLRSFSALGDQRAEILPVQRPPTLAVGEHYMTRLARILIFPFFSLSIMDQLPLN